MSKNILKIICFLTIISLLQGGVFLAKPTYAYFVDEEASSQSYYEAGSLDFSLNSTGDFNPEVTPSQSSSRVINMQNVGTLGFKYTVEATNFSGTLCDELRLEAGLDTISKYTGLLEDFSYDAGEFSAPGSWQFIIPALSDDITLQGQTCNFDFVFNGNQLNHSGFSDTEVVSSSVKSSYWNAPVVLNEFLPNANNYLEYIEIYNKTGSSIELDGFYIETDNSTIPVNVSTTAQYSGGLTMIAANGWLVVTTGGDLINDDSGTITLYNQNGIEVDSYSYTAPIYNINNNPGWTNNLVGYWPFEGDLSDKSGNNNNGTSIGTIGTTGFVSGKINQALSLSGTNYIEIPDSLSLDITDQITLEAWVYPNTWNDSYENSILTKAGDNDYGVWNLHYKTEDDHGFRFELNNGAVDNVNVFETPPAPPSSPAQWYHVVGVYDGSTMSLYLNGILTNSKAVAGPISTNDDPLRIGKQLWWGATYSYWDGLIDEVKIYNRALNASEVLEHYNDVNSSGVVPVDKSYARIPDGSDNWIDPIPTPGAPNKLSEQEKVELGLIPPIITTTTTIPEQTTTTTTVPEVTTTTTTVLPISSTTFTIPEEQITTTTTTTEPVMPVGGTVSTTTTTTTIVSTVEEPTTTTTTTEPPVSTTTTTTTEPPVEEDFTTTTTTITIPEQTTTTTTVPEVTTTTTTEQLPEENPTTTTTIEPPVSTTTTTIPEEPITTTTTTIPKDPVTTTTTTIQLPVSTDSDDDSTAINLINIYFV